ncbi:retrovirus-related pol polyprotein from transposon TNT 1-94 [Tanacetum coccineum]
MRNKMVQINYAKLNALYETFVPQQDFSMEQTYFSIPFTSTNGSESKAVTSDLPIPKMHKESNLLKMFDTLGGEINGLRTRIDNTLIEDRQRRWISDSQNSLREFYKTNVIPMSASLSKNLKELKEELLEEELDELIKHVNQKTYAYADVRYRNQDLLITKSELKNKLKTVDMGKNMNTKFDKSETSGTLLYVTSLPKNIAIKAKKVSNSKVNADRCRSSNSVRIQKSKDTKSKNRVLKNTNAKGSTTHVRKMSHSVSIDSNKYETMNSTLCHVNKSVLNTKNVTVVNEGLNIVCVSCGKDVFLLSHEKCVARYALSRNSSVTRALFTTTVAAEYKNLGVTSIVEKYRLSVAKTLKATNKAFSASSLSHDSSQSNLQLLRNFVEKFMGTVRFGNDHFAAIIGYGDYVQGNLMICHGDDLLAGSCDSNLYTVSIFEMAASSLVCLMSRATSTKSWLRHRRLSHLNFDTINQLMSKYLVDGILKFKYNKITYVQPVEQALEFLWTEHIATACFTQNCSIVLTRYNKTPYELIRGRKPNIQYFHVFGSLYYPTNDRDDLGKMKPKADNGICIGYSESSRGFHIYNRRTKKIMEMIHVKFDELAYMASECNNLEPEMNCMNFQDSSEDLHSIPSKSDLENLFGPLYEEYYATSSQEVSDNSATNTLNNEHTSSSSSIVVEEDEAP